MRFTFALVLLVACSEVVAPPEPPPEVYTQRLALRAEVSKPDTVMRDRRMVATLVREAQGVLAEPMPQQIMHFRVVLGGGSVFTGSELTNLAGEARNIWTLGPRAAMQVLESYWIDQATGNPVVVRDTVFPLPDTAVAAAVDTAPVLLLAGERFALSRRVGEARDRYGNVVPEASVRYSVPAPWRAAADTIWADSPAQGEALVTVGVQQVAIRMRALIRQLTGSYDVRFACAYTSAMVGRAGLRDSMVVTMRTDSVEYAVTAHNDGTVWMSGDVRHYWSDGATEYESGKRLTVPIQVEIADTVRWGSSGVSFGEAVRTPTGWEGGNFCLSMYFAADAQLVSVPAVLTQR